jgi:hypothetical protein
LKKLFKKWDINPLMKKQIESQKELLEQLSKIMESLQIMNEMEEKNLNDLRVKNSLTPTDPVAIQENLFQNLKIYKQISQLSFEKISDNEIKIEISNICEKDPAMKLIIYIVVEDKFYIKKCYPESIKYMKFGNIKQA